MLVPRTVTWSKDERTPPTIARQTATAAAR
jgi:hypothetical protein